MKLWKNCLSVVGLGLLLLLASCSADVSRDSTEGFLSGLSTMFASAMTQESNNILNDFNESSPPGPKLPEIPELGSYVQMPVVELSGEKLRAPASVDSLYGTWDFVDINGWVHINRNNPANAILFKWDYLDTAQGVHAAELLIDSLEFYQDTLPTDVWIGIKIDDEPTWLAWLKFEATYTSLEQASAVSLVYEIVGYYQVGVSVTAPIELDTAFNIDSTDFVGTVHLWVIDRTSRDYRVDLTVTRNADDSGVLVLEDSNGWEMDVDVSAVVETVGECERRNASGEITRNGTHAADIDGEIWNPEDNTHHTAITVTFSDGSENSLLAYLSEGLLTLGD
jgi:hypothetical protein